MTAHHRVELSQHEAVGIVAPVLARDVDVSGTGRGAHLDGGSNTVARHQIFSPWRRSRATTASIPSRSTTLMPLALIRSLTRRFSEGR